MGDEDALSSERYSKTARCKSIKAEVLAIKAIDFLALVKSCRRARATICKREIVKLDKQMNQVHLLKRVASLGAEHQDLCKPKKQYLMKASEFFFNRDDKKEELHEDVEPVTVKAAPLTHEQPVSTKVERPISVPGSPTSSIKLNKVESVLSIDSSVETLWLLRSPQNATREFVKSPLRAGQAITFRGQAPRILDSRACSREKKV